MAVGERDSEILFLGQSRTVLPKGLCQMRITQSIGNLKGLNDPSQALISLCIMDREVSVNRIKSCQKTGG